MVKNTLIGLGAAVGLFAACPAHAQKPDTAPSAPTVTLDQPRPSAGALDETALRYYASKRDLGRVEAEIRRLQALDPSWQPPKDLLAPKPATAAADETPVWDLAAKGKTAEARAKLAEIKRLNPTWTASPALEKHLSVQETRGGIQLASAARKWSTVAEIAGQHPELVACDTIDIMWTVAQAYGELGRKGEANDLFGKIIATCPNEKERQDTLLKASAYVSETQLAALLNQEAARSSTEGKPRFEQVRAQLERGNLSRKLTTAKGTRLDPTEVKSFEEETRAAKDGDGAVTLGWYYHNEKNHREAEKWFLYANALEPDENSAEGLVYTYLALKDRERAVDAAKPWSTSDKVRKALASDKGSAAKAKGKPATKAAAAATQRARGAPAVRAEPAGDAVAAAMRAATAAHARGASSDCLAQLNPVRELPGWTGAMAEMRGWCLLSLKRETEARMAFEEAKALGATTAGATPVSTGVSGTPNDEDNAQLGVILSRLQAGMVDEALRDLATSNLSRAKIAELHADALSQQAIRHYEAGHYAEALRLIDARNQVMPPRRDLEILRAYSLRQENRITEALDIFQQLDKLLSTPESREGIRVITGGY
jgi:tetratricopeptide (TPR) repeat protein